jgi:hypothetical protein
VTGHNSRCSWPSFGAVAAKNQGSSHKDFPTTASIRRHQSEYAVIGPISIGTSVSVALDQEAFHGVQLDRPVRHG